MRNIYIMLMCMLYVLHKQTFTLSLSLCDPSLFAFVDLFFRPWTFVNLLTSLISTSATVASFASAADCIASWNQRGNVQFWKENYADVWCSLWWPCMLHKSLNIRRHIDLMIFHCICFFSNIITQCKTM